MEKISIGPPNISIEGLDISVDAHDGDLVASDRHEERDEISIGGGDISIEGEKISIVASDISIAVLDMSIDAHDGDHFGDERDDVGSNISIDGSDGDVRPDDRHVGGDDR